MKNTIKYLVATLLVAVFTAGSASAATTFFNGFETDTTGWFNNGGVITRVASGTNGISSADGDFHAEVQEGVYTQWGGYENAFPANGYATQLDVYLDTALADGSDLRFDFSSAINKPDGTHRRDFIFSVGTLPGVTGEWVMSASNNSPGWPANPDRDPFSITESGWYTLRHSFMDDGTGVLEAVMDVLDADENVLHSWTLSDPTDIIGDTVGGSRYGWFIGSDFEFLAIDNTEKFELIARDAEITAPTVGEEVSGMVSFNAYLQDDDIDTIQWAVREGTCAAGTNTVFGNVDGHSDVATIDTTDLSNQTFSFTGDMTALTPGMYCFIYNPTEDAGETEIRETVEFILTAVEEPVTDPTDKEQCKNGAWEAFGFRNQGQCIRFVNTGQDSR